MKHLFNILSGKVTTFMQVWRREYYLVFHDLGVMLFFFALTIGYPIVYTLIYNPEIVENIPIAVVDHSRTQQSRRLAQMIDATQGVEVYDYVPNLQDARRLQNEHKVYGVLEIPADYAKRIGRGQQGVATFYAEMSLLLRYRTFLSALTDVELASGSEIRRQAIDIIGLPAQDMNGLPVESESVMLGDPTQGFASFIMPGILVLILQQSMLLGVTMLAAGVKERRRRFGGIDPETIPAGAMTTIWAKTLCYVTLYIPICVYVLNLVPIMFNLPHIGSFPQMFIFILPMLIAAAFMGQAISVFVTERESSLLVIVFTSVVFLFLSGLTWPRYAMSDIWTWVGDAIPATWGVEGFIRMNSNGSPLWEQARPYTMLWILAACYMTLAWLVTRFSSPRSRLAPTK
ncbi:MAG: ABC transporter permease [Firmicutes bacterium]|nr:ABC transporter permease [Bacillota bacterium]MCM1402110.1 ABC transporter permease [Bacteroides sp.]MCM1477515.1 ABC transporter permease [Bacteroides sp.]